MKRLKALIVLVTTPEQFKNATVTGRFILLFEEISAREITDVVLLTLPCSKRSILKCFPFARKLKAGVFKFLRFEERFRKAPFS